MVETQRHYYRSCVDCKAMFRTLDTQIHQCKKHRGDAVGSPPKKSYSNEPMLRRMIGVKPQNSIRQRLLRNIRAVNE